MFKESKLFKKIFIVFFIVFYFLNFSIAAAAAEGASNVGPQEPVGIQGPVGPTETPGPKDSVGDTGSVGPAEQSGVSQEPADSSSESIGSTVDQTTNSTNVSEASTTSPASTGNPTSDGNSTTIDTQNDATINNNVNLDLKTGGNTVGSNSVVGDINTGNIDGSVTLIDVTGTELGAGSTVGVQSIDGSSTNEISLFPTDERITLANFDTGSGSDNLNSVSGGNNVVQVFDSNNSQVNNTIDITADSGSNTVLSNTSVGNVTTGDINLNLSLINLLNLINPNLVLTIDIWNILGDFSGDIIAPELANFNTGENSANNNYANVYSSEYIRAYQEANVDNYFDFNANTGENNIGNNTSIGNILTGGTRINGQVTNLSNIADLPVFYLFNVYGKWDGSYNGIDPSKVIINEINDTTGPDSSNSNSASSGSSLTESIQNDASVSNKISVNANTGLNKIANNTVTKNITTGAINISANVVNVVNALSHATGQFALRVVNIFGNWTGNLSGQRKTAVSDPSLTASTSLSPPASSPGNLAEEPSSNEDPVSSDKNLGKVFSSASVDQLPKSDNQTVVSKSIGSGAFSKTASSNDSASENSKTKIGLLILFCGALLLIFLSSWIIEKILTAKKDLRLTVK